MNQTCRRWRWRAAVAMLVAAAGCGPHLPDVQRLSTTGSVRPSGGGEFVLAPGDLLSLKFYNNKEMDEDVAIRPDGKISVQLLGDVQAAGRSPAQLAADLKRGYTGELAHPRISVIVRKFDGHRVYVGGEVAKQGIVTLDTPITLFEAIQEAGGLLPTAHRKNVILIRQGPDGKPIGHAIDVRPLMNGTHPEDDVLLQPYDIVFVPRSKIGNADLFAQQYIQGLLPTIPIPFAITP